MAISTEMPNVAEAGDEVEHLLAAERVEAGGRLVEQHQLGVADERLGELGPLPHAGGEAADRTEAGLVEADEVEHVGRPLARGTRRQAAQLAERRDDVGRGLVERQAVVLGHVAEPRADADRVAADVDAAHLDRPCGRVGEAEQQPEHRRLAGTVGADEADAAPRHLDGEVVERGGAGIALRDVIDANQAPGIHDVTSLSGTHRGVRPGAPRRATKRPRTVFGSVATVVVVASRRGTGSRRWGGRWCAR